MWPSSIDLTTGTFPNDKKTSYNKSTAIMPKGCTLLPGKRAYRYIDAPHGSSIYWDQPMLVALSLLSSYDNNNYLKGRAEDYITFFLQNCTAKNGAFLWGNHYYYDFNKKGVVFFEGDEEPKLCDSSESGLLHEIRPFSPAWELFWNVSGEQVKKHIYFMAENHVFNSQGGFNRHADKKQGCAFLEAGGILAESLCYLYRKTNDKKLVEQAKDCRL